APNADVLAHRAPDQRDLAVERSSSVDDLLYAVYVRGEARHNDPSLTARKDLLEVRPDTRLRRREAVAVDVRRIATQQQHSLAPELGQTGDVGRRAARPR